MDSTLSTEPAPPPSKESIEDWNERMQWWKDSKFGMFIHYGLYSGLEGEYKGSPIAKGLAEWYQQVVGLDSETYEKMAIPKFKPSKEATEVWTDLAVKAGCQYVVLTSKHHEGFGLFESKLGDFNSKAKIDRDLVSEYVDNCRQRNLKVGLYHSLIDWKHRDYDSSSKPSMPYPKGESERTKHVKKDHSKYIEYLHGQVQEILSNYGTIDILWFDFSHFGFDGEKAWKAHELLEKIRKLQSKIVVNNRMYRRKEAGFAGDKTDDIVPELDRRYGDFITPEQFVPPEGIQVNWESCMTLNNTWGYSRFDHEFKSLNELIWNLVSVVSRGGNFLLNIGPKVDGSLTPQTMDRMQGIGEWMAVNKEAILKCDMSPFGEVPWGAVTCSRENNLYLHVNREMFDKSAQKVIINKSLNVKRAFFLGDSKQTIQVQNSTDSVTFVFDTLVSDISVIKVELSEPL